MDAMVANSGSENEILIGDGQGGFTSTLLERTDGSRGVTSGDWNGDGLMDAMVANYNSGNEILIGDGQGGFTSTLLERTDYSSGVTSGDWNGDGLMDAMVANSGGENEILIGDGQGGFTSTLLERTDYSLGVTSGDWNGDGLMDAMVANAFSDVSGNEVLQYDRCSDGFAWRLGDSTCYQCPRHTTDTWLSSKGCELCPAGRIGPGPGLGRHQRFFCIPCEAGKARSLNATECDVCQAGKYASAGAATCDACQGGQVTNTAASGSTGCFTCSAGEGPNAINTACEPCTGTQYSITGRCQDCAEPNVVSDDHHTCTSCAPGKQPNDERTACVPCIGATYSQFGATCSPCNVPSVVMTTEARARIGCGLCGPGQGPSANGTVCEPCAGATYSVTGTCEYCAGVVGDSARACTACPDRQQPDASRTRCRCSDGNFNTSTRMRCYAMDWSEPPLSLQQCLPCEDLECVGSCDGGFVDAKPGWLALTRDDNTTSIFECKHPDACTENRCAEGYGGPLCGVCDVGFNQDSEGRCNKCEETTWVGLAVLLAMVFAFVLLLTQIEKWYATISALNTIVELARSMQVQAITKVLVATMQIATNFAVVLNIPFPQGFKALLDLFSFFRFDFSLALGIGCVYRSSYMTSLIVSFAMVVVVMGFMGVDYLYLRFRATDESQLRTLFAQFDKDGNGVTESEIAAMIDKVREAIATDDIRAMFARADVDASGWITFDEFRAAFDDKDVGLGKVLRLAQQAKARDDCLGRLFLIIFLMYPSLTSKIFEIFLCRRLGPHISPGSILHADYNIDCATTVLSRWIIGLALATMWAIGVPVMLLWLMSRVREQLRSNDEDAVNMFKFLVADYKAEFYYWEVVELGRKLMLSGVISLLGRGSIAQVVAATMMSFIFFAINLKVAPYKSHSLNVIKAISEVQLFVVLLVCVVLQVHHVGFTDEFITVDGYGAIQTIATVLIAPIAIFLMVQNVRGVAANVEELIQAHPDADEQVQVEVEASTAEDEFANPLSKMRLGDQNAVGVGKGARKPTREKDFDS
eukprot:COSAG06_NODE_2908_length_6105_cov_9.949384_2_plen_1038_part_00